MNDGLAYCGLTCETCPIYLATREEDKEKQAKLKEKILYSCLDLYGYQYTLEHITDCDGCRSDGGRLFTACKDCPIRNCARERGLESCASCAEYACASLRKFFQTEPDCKERLDEIRNTLKH